MSGKTYLIVWISLITLTACSKSTSIAVEEYALVSRPEVQDLDIYFKVAGEDSQDILASRQLFAPFHRFIVPVYIDEKLVWVETQPQLDGDHLSVYIGEDLVYRNTLDDLVGNASIEPWGTDRHWFIEFKQLDENGDVKGHILQDGQELNDLIGYDESFGFVLLGERPFYFYEKNNKIGFSYGGEEHELKYEKVLHYGCCNDGFLNPYYSSSGVSFFARNNSQWYYVEVQVEP